MTSFPPRGTRDDEPILDLLRRLRGEVEQILASYELDEREAEDVLQEILSMLIYRWDRIANRELWLLATLKRSCLRRTQDRPRRSGHS
jgi:DNA-directed RNA polymerase specialized sigma24 family protein